MTAIASTARRVASTLLPVRFGPEDPPPCRRVLVPLLLFPAVALAGCREHGPLTPGQSGVRLDVEPDSTSVTTGDSVRLEATVIGPSGASLAESVTWRSLAEDVAAVDGDGTVTGTSAGTADIEAESGGSRDTATVEVLADTTATDSTSTGGSGGGASPVVDECASPESAWIWCDDFQRDRLSSYFEYDDAGGSFIPSRDIGVEGSRGMRVRFSEGQVGAGSLHLAFGDTPDAYFTPVDAGTRDYREIYWRLYVRYQEGWVGGGGSKLSRATSFAASSWAQSMIAHVWSGGSQDRRLVIDPASGTDETGLLQTTGYNDFENLRWLGSEASATPIFAPEHHGQWHCVEARVRLNRAGQSDGVFQLWIDGQLEAERVGLNWVGTYDEYGINAVFVSNYWNEGAPAAQERYIDNLVVSTERIGCP